MPDRSASAFPDISSITSNPSVIPTAAVELDLDPVIFNMLTLKGIYGREMFETWYQMSVLVDSGLDISPVITHRFPYSEFEGAFEVAASGDSGKVLLDWKGAAS